MPCPENPGLDTQPIPDDGVDYQAWFRSDHAAQEEHRQAAAEAAPRLTREN
ncbi:MAG: hypothetical protein ACKO0V_11290 [bacterium]